MSYENINQSYYETFQQGTPFHAGAPGWTKAPWPTWGENPNMAGRSTLAVNGLGAASRRRRRFMPGLQFGDDAVTAPSPIAAPLTTPMKVLLGVGLFGAALAYSMRGGPQAQGHRANPAKQDTKLETEAFEAGRRWRQGIRRGDISARGAFDNSGVGYPYMTASEYAKAKKAFYRGAR
jgi:hypothetical protein